ncbi:U6 snRNA phosphodiesterase-like [Xenia sp. Carnegie-2017]|uniref:U6 snRNA phosphodiesterase-like n=1 Tax=Xenia sp. Carnegie-2017 TaxID=2897299 RepID=UPI001F034492|nr:U6 snRNA phosphodiesterase-like [Xenia sp. Carnegie-2017]
MINSLKLLADTYGEDEDDTNEADAVKTTPSSQGIKRQRESNDDINGLEKISKEKLEIPSGILDMFNGSEGWPDDASLHQGRTRGFNHFPGNWATHVFVPFDLPETFDLFISYLRKIWSNEDFELHIFDTRDFHVSISRTVPIRHHWIKPLTKLLEHGFHGKRRFICDFQKVSLYVNDDRTRTFLALDVTIGISQLKDLVLVVDKAFREFGLQEYYDEPSFHASFAWCLGDAKEHITSSMLTKLQSILDSYMEESSSLVVETKEIRCHIGNKSFHFDLLRKFE